MYLHNKPKIELKEGMSLDKFKDYCRQEDYNHVKEWDVTKFRVMCRKCSSEDVEVYFRSEEGAMGSEYTGYMPGFIHNAGLLVKCKGCGHAMDIGDPNF